MVLWQCFQTQTEIRDIPYVAEVWEKLSRVFTLAQSSPSPSQSSPHPFLTLRLSPLPL